MRVLVVDGMSERTEALREGLERAGHTVAAWLESPLELLHAIETARPDVVVIHTDSPGRDVLEPLVMISRDQPRPIVMFASDDAPEIIRDAVRSGVTAYVVDGLEPGRVKAIVEVAVARFAEHQRLRGQLASAEQKLEERKLVDRAKGLLMKSRGMGEAEAYEALRRMAMERGRRIGEVARRVIEMGDLLG